MKIGWIFARIRRELEEIEVLERFDRNVTRIN